jgi:hypothetical protein
VRTVKQIQPDAGLEIGDRQGSITLQRSRAATLDVVECRRAAGAAGDDQRRAGIA